MNNGMINKRPRLIARCVDAADLITAVNFGRDEGLPIAIQGGGHNGPGLGSCDDGLVIDLSMMNSVRADPANRSVRRIRHKIANPTEILLWRVALVGPRLVLRSSTGWSRAAACRRNSA